MGRIEVNEYGTKRYYSGNKLHRIGGPAIEWKNGRKAWYVDGVLHRDGGLPAVDFGDGEMEWWINGVQVTEEKAKSN